MDGSYLPAKSPQPTWLHLEETAACSFNLIAPTEAVHKYIYM